LAVFLLIMAIVLVRGRAIGRVFETSGAAVEDVPVTRIATSVRNSRLVRHHRAWLAAVALTVGLIWPQLPYFNTAGNSFLLTLVLIFAVVGVGLTMLLGWGGQVSLGHFAVVGLGAYIAAHLSSHGWSLAGLFLVAGVVGAAVTVLVGLPALRVRGLTLAVTTLGFAVISTDWLLHQSWVGSDKPFGMTVELPRLGAGLGTPQSERAVYYVALAVLALAVAAAAALRRSSPGRLLVAVRDNERASAACGVTPATVKLSIPAASGVFAGAAQAAWQRYLARSAAGASGAPAPEASARDLVPQLADIRVRSVQVGAAGGGKVASANGHARNVGRPTPAPLESYLARRAERMRRAEPDSPSAQPLEVSGV